MPIDSIAIQAVRGIRDRITLRLNGRSLLLHGANGTGKSSVEKALRWALAGREEPTRDAPHTTEESYRRHVLAGENGLEPRVSITFTDGSTIEVARGTLEADGNAAVIRDACERGLPFLRRAELLDVLSSRPVDRFQYFESFLGLSDADEVIKLLGDLKSTKERRSSELTSRRDGELGALLPLLPEGGASGIETAAELEQAAIDWFKELGIPSGTEAWSEASRALAKLLPTQGEGTEDRRHSVALVIETMRRFLNDLHQQTEVPEELEQKRRELENDVVDAGQLELLQHALRHFEAKEGEQCPICGSRIDWEQTAQSLRHRSDQLSEFAETIQSQKAVARVWLKLWRSFSAALEEVERLFESDDLNAIRGDPPAGVDLIMEADSDDRQLAAITQVGGGPLGKYMEETASRAAAVTEDLHERLPDQNALPALRLASSFAERYEGKRPGLQLVESELRALRSDLVDLTSFHEVSRRARQDVARDLLGAIGSQVHDYYLVVHPENDPEDETGAPAIEVQRHGRGTAFVRGKFSGEDVRDPRWVYSDGHLDTVAICIFLALRRYRADQGVDAKLLILDDIVLSIDLGHARRLIDLLNSEFGDHQILLFTHNGLFAHWCATLMPGLRRLQIKQWSLQDGPRVGEYLQGRDRLEQSLDDAQPKEIGLHLMWFMDEWLAEARYVYQVSVPARPDERYTLTDIWQPFAKVVRKMGKALSSSLGGAVEAVNDLPDLPAIRNALPAHENEFAREFPRKVMVEVARRALDLVNALYCADCRSFAAPVPHRFSPSIVHCRCKKIQYVEEVGD